MTGWNLRGSPKFLNLLNPRNCQVVARAGVQGSLEMLKMEQPPGMCMKTKTTMTKCLANYTPFTQEKHELPENRQQFSGLCGRKCTSHAIIRGEGGQGSAHLTIGSSIHQSGTGWDFVGPITPTHAAPALRSPLGGLKSCAP